MSRIDSSVFGFPCALFVGALGLVAAGCGPKPVVEGPPPPPADCATRQFNAPEVQGKVRPAVVRLVAGRSTGTGFVVSSPKAGVEIVTNHHVIAEGDTFKAIIPTSGGANAEIGGLEVVMVDTKNDLAILKAPDMGAFKALEINRAGVMLGQKVAAMGYPYVAGSDDFELTFEPGDVSAVTRKIKEREFVQTNANINPGNSGGPVVDACGQVVGVVVATSTQQQRIGLIVPVQKLTALLSKYEAPRPPAKTAIPGQLKKLEKAIQYRKGREAATLFSRGFLRQTVLPDFIKYLKRAEAKESAYATLFAAKGVDYYKAPMKARINFLKGELPRYEFQAWLVAQMIKLGQKGMYEALGDYLSLWITEVFGEVQAVESEGVEDEGAKSAKVQLKIATSQGNRFWEFTMIDEWGDWRIEKASCMRGCK